MSDYRFCIAGSPSLHTQVPVDALDVSRRLGGLLAERNATLLATTTVGFALWVAMGAQQGGSISIAFSPAANQKEHKNMHHLPVDHFDTVIYTGFGVSGASVLAIRSSDAVIFGAGGMASVLECVVAIQEQKPIALLRGSWDLDEILADLLHREYPDYPWLVMDDDPARLVSKLTKTIEHKRELEQSKM